VTVNGFLNTLYAFGGISALIYGTSKYVLEPMVKSLSEARIDLHDTANQNLTKLVEKLEGTVSELPPALKKPQPDLILQADADTDAVSEYDDPTELFHRDIGVQTSVPPSPVVAAANTAAANASTGTGAPSPLTEKPTVQQARKLTQLVASVKEVSDGLVGQTEDFGELKTALDALSTELDDMAAQSSAEFSGGFSLYGSASRLEPDDEIKKAKENIRRVKGVLLSTRNFPMSAR